MIKLSEIVKEYGKSGAVNSCVNLFGFVADDYFLTKSSDVGVVLKVEPRDYECVGPEGLDAVARRFEAAVRLAGHQVRIYQYVIKRNGAIIPPPGQHLDPIIDQALQSRAADIAAKAGDLYTSHHYIVILYEGSRQIDILQYKVRGFRRSPLAVLTTLFSTEKTIGLIEEAIHRGIQILANVVNSFIVQLHGAVNLSVANKHEAFTFFRRLLNFNPDKVDLVPLCHDQFVDYFVCDSGIECHRDHLRLDDYYVKVLTLKDLPAKTYANMLRSFQELPSQYVIVTEFAPVDNFEIRRLIKQKQRHAFNSKTSPLAHLNTQGGPDAPGDYLVDESQIAVVDELNQCLTALEMKGSAFGQYTLTVILYDLDRRRLEKSAAEAFKSLAGQGATLHEERYNLLNAFMAALPGNTRYNLRSLYLPLACYADLSLLHSPHPGEPLDAHLGAECLAVFETRQRSLYRFSLHYYDLAHAVVLGTSGSGKSFLLNFLVTHAQKYTPRTIIFDIGGSYEMITRQFGGSYMPIAFKNRPFTINPFSLPPTASNTQFLCTFVKVLIESSGNFTMSDQDERELFTQIGSLYHIDASQRRLLTLLHILPKHLEQYLRRWTEGGQYGDLFDNPVDTLTFAKFQTFDFTGMDDYPQVIEPLLFYILHRANNEISDPAALAEFKICVVDEAWRFLKNATVKQYIVEAMKTWRKVNAAMILATQSAIDFDARMLQIVAESSGTLIFLANPRLDRQKYQDAFKLNDTELDLIAGLRPKQQMLIKRPDVSKVLELNVSAKDYWLYTNNAMDDDLKRRAFETLGFEQGLAHLATQKRAIDSPLT